MKPLPECAAIVLAAGASTRLGEPKQLAQFLGESLLRRSVRICVEAGCEPVFVVLGHDFARMELELSGLDAITVENSEWRSGMASSIRSGVTILMESHAEIERALLMVCDQPFLKTPLLVELMHTSGSTNASAVACFYAGATGVPAVFARRVWPQLLALKGDQGARHLLASCADLVTVEFSDAAIDVDTPDDLAALSSKDQTNPSRD